MPDLLALARPVMAVGLGLIAAASAHPEVTPPRATESVRWRVDSDFERQLDLVAGVTWSERKLRDALDSLARNQQIAIFLDRRVDPDQKIDLSVSDVSLRDCLQRIAQANQQGLSMIGSVVYFGPPETASKLATLAEIKSQQVRALPAPARNVLQKRAAWKWSALSTPRELLGQLAADANLRVVGLENVPHDLWPAGSLPPLTVAERLTLVTAGFGLTFDLDETGRVVNLVPIPEQVSLRRSYQMPAGGSKLLPQLKQMFPDATIGASRGTLKVDGKVEDQRMIQRLLAGKPARNNAVVGEKRYTLKVENQIAGESCALAAKLSLEAEFDLAASDRLQLRVSFEVKDATIEQLLTAAVAPAGLAHKIEGKKLKVFPAPK